MLWRLLVQFQAVPLSDSNLRQVVHIKRVTKQYELVPITTGKVTIGLRMHWHALPGYRLQSLIHPRLKGLVMEVSTLPTFLKCLGWLYHKKTLQRTNEPYV